MNVLLISPSYEPRSGGMETYLAALGNELARCGHCITVLTNRDCELQPENEVQAGVEIIRTSALLDGRGHENFVPWERSYFALLNEFAKLKFCRSFDVVHCHTQVALLLAHLAGLHELAPIVASFHETNPYRDSLGEQRTRFVLRSCPASLYAVGSQAFADQARSFGLNADLIRVVKMGIAERSHIDRKRARGEALLRWHIPIEDRLIVMIGRFTPRKEHARLLSAYARMRTRDRSSIALVGSRNSTDPTYVKQVREMARLAGANVYLLEDLSNDELNIVVDAADIGVQPSSMEGLGLAPVELMMAGVPVVLSDIAGLQEVVGEYAECLVDTADPTVFARRLDELVENDGYRSSLGNSLRMHAVRNLSIFRAAADTIRVYEEVLEGR